jgi:hypothetical protein
VRRRKYKVGGAIIDYAEANADMMMATDEGEYQRLIC